MTSKKFYGCCNPSCKNCKHSRQYCKLYDSILEPRHNSIFNDIRDIIRIVFQ